MPKQKNNIVMRNSRGMFGKQVVFKRRAGVSYVAAPPEVNENRTPTADLENQNRFKSATEYAKNAIKDAATKQAYLDVAKPGQSAYNVAFQDAYNPPEIVSINANNYQGQAGNITIVHAKDCRRSKNWHLRFSAKRGCLMSR